MNKDIECESCIKRKTIYCPNSSECYETENKPYWQNRLMLLEENIQLKLDFELYKDNHIYKNYEVERKDIVIKELRSWLEEEKNRLARECSQIYEDSLGKTRLVNEDIFNEVNKILSKLNELEGGKND